MASKISILTFCFICVTHWALGQMTPNAPVKNFRMPRFAESGYTQWVLQGATGIYDGPEQVRVEDMLLRVYSADDRMALEMLLDSPKATLRIQENKAYSDSAIRIEGANFEITGVGWTWDGLTKEIVVLKQARVKFAQTLSNALVTAATEVGGDTVIRSEQLTVKTSATDYSFDFQENVTVASGSMLLKSDALYALAETPDGSDQTASMSVAELNSVREVQAKGSVLMTDRGRIVRSNQADFYPREQRAVLTGDAQVELETAFLSGAKIESQAGEITLLGDAATGRSQMILLQTGGLGLQGQSNLDAETIVLADSIRIKETTERNEFYFVGSVGVMSGALQMESDQMTILTGKSDPAKAAEGDTLQMGVVQSMLSEGAVRVRNGDVIATGEQVEFFPQKESAVLTGSPRIQSGETIVDGVRMVLEPAHSIVYGEVGNPVVVRLPSMPDIGYSPRIGAPAATVGSDDSTKGSDGETASTMVEKAASPTIIKSLELEMFETATSTRFEFRQQVEVLATNLLATCQRMEVLSSKEKGTAEAANQLQEIIAYDSVSITQEGRVATAEKATILPDAGKLILEENAVVEDDRGKVSGHRLTLLKGERRAIVEGGGANGDRARITLPAIPKKEE